MEIYEIEKNENLKKALLDLVSKIFIDKKLSLPTNDYIFDSCLVNSKIIKVQNSNYEIIDFGVISYYIIEKYKVSFDFIVTSDFNKNVEFLKRIDSDFNADRHVHNFHILEKYIWQVIIEDSNIQLSCDFNEYLNSINKENNSDEIFQFIEAYSIELPKLNLSVENIYENAILLLEFSKSDATYNLPLGSILNGIKQKCKSDYSIGLELFDHSFSQTVTNDNIISSIISGLYENKREEFYKTFLNAKIESEINLNAIFLGLANVTDLENAECTLFIQLYDKFESNDNLIFSLSSLLIAILKSSNSIYHKDCFDRIKSSLKKENTVYFILNNLCYLDNQSEEKSDLLVTLIEQEYFTVDKFIKPIEHYFWYLNGIEPFKKVILALIGKAPFESISKGFESYLTTLDKIELDNFLIELLIDNRANKRFAALNLFDELSTRNPYKFSIDVTLLPSINQYKLWVSLTQNFKEPKYHIPALLPLLNSKNEFIRESFLCKLEEISEDYGGHVIDVLNNNLNNEDSNHKKILNRVQNYISNFYEINVDVKNSINELNPYCSQNKKIKYFNKLLHKKMSQSMNKGAEDNSFLRLLSVNTVQLSKGGGWRYGNKKELSKLGSVEASFSLPRSYFINPNQYEMQKGFEMRRDWADEEFDLVINVLDDEQQ